MGGGYNPRTGGFAGNQYSYSGDEKMRILLTVAVTFMFVAGSAFADTCADRAAQKKLAGAAMSSFMKKCEKDEIAKAACETRASEKKLAGGARSAFMRKCVKDGGPADNSCAVQAEQKKLHGAARSSFVKKCEADRGK